MTSFMGAERIKHQNLLRQVAKYYTLKLSEHGATPEGVDWNSQESQIIRFNQLLEVTGEDRKCSVLDYGCGYGAMARHMRDIGYIGTYVGFDISEEMIKVAREQQSELQDCDFISDTPLLPIIDYTLASGLFNVKQDVPVDMWQSYVVDTIHEIAEHSRKGFSFNMLTVYSDQEKMSGNLYYGDPGFYVDHCIRNYSRYVTVNHCNYGLHEFTMLVRKK